MINNKFHTEIFEYCSSAFPFTMSPLHSAPPPIHKASFTQRSPYTVPLLQGASPHTAYVVPLLHSAPLTQRSPCTAPLLHSALLHNALRT